MPVSVKVYQCANGDRPILSIKRSVTIDIIITLTEMETATLRENRPSDSVVNSPKSSLYFIDFVIILFIGQFFCCI